MTLPILTIFSTLSLILLFLLLLLGKIQDRKIKFIFGSLLFLALLSSVPKLLYQETRYTFFLVPIIIILVISSYYEVFRKLFIESKLSHLFTMIIIFGIFYISNDFNLNHIINIAEPDYNYRLVYNSKMKNHLYRRWDSKTTTDFVKDNMNPDDIIIINENSLEYYLPKVDYYNFHYKHSAFPAISANSGQNEKWSGSKLIYKNEDLFNIIENRENTVWYLVFPENWLKEINFSQKYKDYLVYEAIDGLIRVYRFP